MTRSEKLVITPSWQPLLQAHGLNGVAAVYRFAGGEGVTQSSSTEVRRLILPEDGGSRTLYLKKYWVTKPHQLWSGFFRGTFFGRSKARQEYENLSRLRAWGFEAPAAVAYGEERRGGFVFRSFLLSEGVPDPVPLDLLIRDRLPQLNRKERALANRELIEKLAEYTRRLHEHRFVHHDLFWRNILLTEAKLTTFALIDAHKGGCWGPLNEIRSRAKDLATLDAPAPWFFRRSERLRFFLQYRQHGRLTAEDKKLLRRTLRMADGLRERQLERVRRARYSSGEQELG